MYDLTFQVLSAILISVGLVLHIAAVYNHIAYIASLYRDGEYNINIVFKLGTLVCTASASWSTIFSLWFKADDVLKLVNEIYNQSIPVASSLVRIHNFN